MDRDTQIVIINAPMAGAWSLMLLALSGLPPPPPPPIPGRRHRAPPDTDRDEFAERWDERTKPATLIDSEDTALD